MFKSIEYKLILYLSLLILAVAGTTFMISSEEYLLGIPMILVVLVVIYKLYVHYNRFNKNILFLLNALDNGDYSFHFTENKLTKREAELNKMMNHIKDILSRARQEIIENERFLSLIIESVSTGIIILDQHNLVHITNRATNQLLGMPVFTHLNQLATLDNSFPLLFKNLKIGDSKQIKVMNERQEVQINLSVSELKLHKGTMKIVVLSNIGNELEAKEMESWVRLIRVMTHEIMNSIAPITSLSDTLLYRYKTKQDDTNAQQLKENTIEAMEIINSTAKGLITFVDSYRQFTGVATPVPTPFYVLPLIEKVLKLEANELEQKNISTQLQCSPTILLHADQSQLTQVLINLIKNAIEATSANGTGKLHIAVDKKDAKIHIRVRNNGTPIAKEVVPNIFIPFFTTKDKGTGIGLSLSRYIIRLHGGNLQHYTDKEWTVFCVVL